MTDLVIRNTVSSVTNAIVSTLPTLPGYTSAQLTALISSALNNFITTNTPNIDIPLSGVSVDFETNKANLLALLIDDPLWKDQIVAETGILMINIIATALTYMQMNIVRAAQESMSDTLRIPSSALASTRFLGVKIARAIPAKHKAIITRSGNITSSLEILPYNQFQASNSVGGNVSLFNRDTIIFPAGIDAIDFNLYEGTANNSISFISDGSADQRFIIGENNYAVSDIDIVCTVDGVVWQRTQVFDYFNIGFWEYNSTDAVFSDETTSDGNVEIQFGNGKFGQIPQSNATIGLSYVVTSGASGNYDLTNSLITNSSYSFISGIISSKGVGGTDPLAPLEYKSLGPGLFAAKYRASSRQDRAAVARRYPGVIDAIFEGQKELAPNDLRQMLLSRCTLLTNTIWTTDDFNDFVTWFSNLDMANMVLSHHVPTPITMDVSADIYCFNNAALSTIQSQVTANLQKKFTLRAGILGYNIAVSDINDIIRRTNRSVIDYFDLHLPMIDTNILNDQYVVLGNVTLNMHYTTRIGQ